jgi:hypothetical protein
MNNIFKSIYQLDIILDIILLLCIIILLLNMRTKVDGFTPFLRGIYRPHVRDFRIKYNDTVNTYSPEFITTKLKRMNLY